MDYAYGYCGMPCALCTRYRGTGTSRCPGCSRDGYYTDVCKVHHCCREKSLAHCAECGGYPCARLGKMGDFRDLDTGGVKARTGESVKTGGFEAWYRDYCEKAELLTAAIEKYNNGRMKRYLCELFIKRPLPELRELMARAAESISGEPKAAGKAFAALVAERDENKAEA